MFKKIDENKPIKTILKTNDKVETFLGEAPTLEGAIIIMDNWIKKNPTISPNIKTFQNSRNNIICNLHSVDIIFTNVNIEFSNIKEKFIISPRGEFPPNK